MAQSDAEAMQLKQQKLLGKLNWLVDRTKPDFKGNAPEFVKPKTKKSVERERLQAARRMQGDANFMPYGEVHPPLSMDATRVVHKESLRHHQTVSSPLTEPAPLTRNAYHQVLDPHTGRPEVYETLHFTSPAHPGVVRGKRRCSAAAASRSSGVVEARPCARDVDDTTAHHRLQLLRADALAHPKFTATTKLAHAGTEWDPSSQLALDAVLVLPKRVRAPLAQRRNEIRMVDVMRSKSSQLAVAWK